MKARFEALSSSDQQAILDKHRDSDDDWWDYVYEDFKRDMEEIGIEVDRIYFSGFWSQGDGACFEGRVSDWPKFLISITAPSRWMYEDIHACLSVSCQHSGHYYHYNSVKFDCDFDGFNAYKEGSLRWHAMEALNEECNEEIEDFFNQCEEAFKDHMKDLYKSLERAYDYLHSDEYVLERLIESEELEGAIDEHLEGTETCTEEDLAEV